MIRTPLLLDNIIPVNLNDIVCGIKGASRISALMHFSPRWKSALLTEYHAEDREADAQRQIKC